MLKQLLFVAALAIALVIAVSCGRSGSTNEFQPAPIPTSAAVIDESKFTATISGKVLFEGTPPEPSKIQMSADPYCASHNPGSAMTQEVVVNPNGTLSNVIVYLKSGVEGAYATPSQPLVLEQRNCAYHPHVFTIMVNQPLVIKNGDATLHNVHIWSVVNLPFNVGQPVQNMETTTRFSKPEMPVPIRCDVHKWMNAFAGVFSHPFHTVTHEEGTFELKVAPRKYEVAAWQEKFGEQTQTVEIRDHEKKEIIFKFGDEKTD
jgi:hypothetical protein